MDQLNNIAACRRTGRTTRILKNMLISPFHDVIFVSKTIEMSRNHLHAFLDLLNDELKCKHCGCQKSQNQYTVIKSKLQVKYNGKYYHFMSADRINPVQFKGLPQFDIHRDHTCYE